jgi:hypothetical protein
MAKPRGSTMQDFVHLRFRVNVKDKDALAQGRVLLNKIVQNRTVRQEIIETLSHIGLDVQDIEVLDQLVSLGQDSARGVRRR